MQPGVVRRLFRGLRTTFNNDPVLEPYADDQKFVGNTILYGPYNRDSPWLDASYQFILENVKPKSSLLRKLGRRYRWSKERTDSELLENYYDNEEWKISAKDEDEVTRALYDIFEKKEKDKLMYDPDSIDTIDGASSDKIASEFKVIQDLTSKALLATNDQTFARRRIKSLTIRIISKLKKKGKISKKSKGTMVGQLLMRTRVASKVMDFSDLMPFHET